MAKTYDERCYELAGWFLSDHPKISNATNRHVLALVIQQAIEDQIEYMRKYGVQTDRPITVENCVAFGDIEIEKDPK
jgi:hypothetical protein